MNLVDSSGWLEYFADGKNSDIYAPAIESSSQLVVSTINIYEVFKLVYQQRGEEAALMAAEVMLRGQVIDVSARIALEAAKFSADRKVAMADSLIYLTAKTNGAVLWTQDKDLESFEMVNYTPK